MNAVALLSLALLAAGPVLAEAENAAVERGELLYRVHCRSCHGAEAAGDGPMAEVLKVKPADLSKLAEKTDSELQRERVYRKIDGREEVRGHGSGDMPVWGLSFRSAGLDSAQEEDVRMRIEDVVAYLATIQAPDGRSSPDDR